MPTEPIREAAQISPGIMAGIVLGAMTIVSIVTEVIRRAIWPAQFSSRELDKAHTDLGSTRTDCATIVEATKVFIPLIREVSEATKNVAAATIAMQQLHKDAMAEARDTREKIEETAATIRKIAEDAKRDREEFHDSNREFPKELAREIAAVLKRADKVTG